jgi:hypothetical protein
MTPAYVNEPGVAQILGKSRGWLKVNRARLEREGFPRVDGLIGLTCVADIEAWIARRRQVADAVPAHTTGNHHVASEGIQYAKL